ncbi:MAG: IS66 family transposase [Chlamydiia bacterium]|nr:IS66 family transposase [Chlamydiia bacterium]
MQSPGRLDFTPEQIETLLNRIEQECLEKEDYPILGDLIRAIVWMNLSLQEKDLTIRRLRSVFGIKTETAEKLLKVAGGDTKSKEPKKKKKDAEKGGHGHKPTSDYTEANIVEVAHQSLKKGDQCPDCLKGKLFQLKPGSVIRIKGQPWLQVEIYKPERLRCSLCGKVFTATLPLEKVFGSRADSTAKAIVSLLKYRGGVPFYRQGQLQEALGAPISPSEIWEMTEDVANAAQPIYAMLCSEAAKGDLIQNDDTTARILNIEIKEEDKRKGVFTTAILSTLKSGVRIGLFFTGRKHAGENLDAVLDQRPDTHPPPIQQCDALSRNIPKNHETQLSNCLAHARRKFYDLVEVWPQAVTKVIGLFSLLFENDRTAPKDPLERLSWHQERSGPIMEELQGYCNSLLETKSVEPNSSFGKAIAYLNNHWEAFTLFLRVPGVILTNNDDEQLIKRSVLNRKNAYFFRTETGAKIADILMSIIETCVYNNVNPWKYLISIQEHSQEIRRNPYLWTPWHYYDRLKELAASEETSL